MTPCANAAQPFIRADLREKPRRPLNSNVGPSNDVMSKEINTNVSEWYCGDSFEGVDELSDLDYACLLLPDLDYESQLNAIKNLLQRHHRANQQISDEIKEIEAHARQLTGILNQQAIDDWLDRLHTSVYQDAAHSMAAVGMLAPLVESIYHQIFLKLSDFNLSQSLLPNNEWGR